MALPGQQDPLLRILRGEDPLTGPSQDQLIDRIMAERGLARALDEDRSKPDNEKSLDRLRRGLGEDARKRGKASDLAFAKMLDEVTPPPPEPSVADYAKSAGVGVLQGWTSFVDSMTNDMIALGISAAVDEPGRGRGRAPRIHPEKREEVKRIAQEFASRTDDAWARIVPVPEGTEGSLPNVVGQGIGSSLGFFASVGIGGPVSTGLKVASVGAAQGLTQGYWEAAEFTDDETARWMAGIANALVGTSESFPISGQISRMFSRWDKASGGLFKQALARAATTGLYEGAEEFVQETGQGGLNNLIMQLAGDEDRQLMDGVIRGGQGGFLAGIFMSALASGPGLRRAYGAEQDRGGALVDEADQLEGEIRPKEKGFLLPDEGVPQSGTSGVPDGTSGVPGENVPHGTLPEVQAELEAASEGAAEPQGAAEEAQDALTAAESPEDVRASLQRLQALTGPQRKRLRQRAQALEARAQRLLQATYEAGDPEAPAQYEQDVSEAIEAGSKAGELRAELDAFDAIQKEIKARKGKHPRADRPVRPAGLDPMEAAIEAFDEGRLEEGGTPYGEEAEAAMGGMRERIQQGLAPVPASLEASENLRLHVNRTAKGKKPSGAQANLRKRIKLPDGRYWVVGKPTVKDWTSRVESTLSPEQINESAQWYEGVLDVFTQEFGEDGAAYATAWLMANVATNPSGAMGSALRGREQAGGLKSDFKAGAAFEKLAGFWKFATTGEDMGKAGGAKIYDFIDSAFQRNTRTWMGDDPLGGEPVVIDRHAARDMGYVDIAMMAHLQKAGADTSQIVQDIAGAPNPGAPRETQYESAAQQYRDLTKKLNKQNWQGRSDWTPRQVQAVGWITTLEFFGLVSEYPHEAVSKNVRNLSVASAPGEGAARFGDEARMDPTESGKAVDEAVAVLQEIADLPLRVPQHGMGGWLGGSEPSSQIEVPASPEQSQAAADILGYLLRQTAVRVERPLAPTKGGAIPAAANEWFVDITGDFDEVVAGEAAMSGLTGIETGYHLIPGGIRVGISRKALPAAAQAKTLDSKVRPALQGMMDALEEAGVTFDVTVRPGEAEFRSNDWTKDTEGEGYLARIGAVYGPGVLDKLRSSRRAEGRQADIRQLEAEATAPAELPARLEEPQLDLFGTEEAELRNERSVSRNSATLPRKDEKLKALLRSEGIELEKGETVSTLVDGYVEAKIPSFEMEGKLVSSPTDAAVLFGALRSPFVERSAWMVVDADGTVLGSSVYAMGTLSSASIPTTAEDYAGVRAAIGRASGKPKLYFSHNHPSGNPAPSNADYGAYVRIAAEAGALGAEFHGIVVNGSRFSSLSIRPEVFEGFASGVIGREAVRRDPGMFWLAESLEYDPLNSRFDATAERRPRVMRATTAAGIARQIQVDEDAVLAIVLDAGARLRAVSSLMVKGRSEVSQLAKEHGGDRVILVTGSLKSLAVLRRQTWPVEVVDIIHLRGDEVNSDAGSHRMTRQGSVYGRTGQELGSGVREDPARYGRENIDDIRGIAEQAELEGEDTEIGSSDIRRAIPSDREKERALFRAVDEFRNMHGDPITVPNEKSRAFALHKLMSDPTGVRALLNRKMREGSALNTWESIAASKISRELMAKAIEDGDASSYRQAVKMADAYRTARAESARALQVVRDPLLTKSERISEAFTDILTTPGRESRRRIAAAEKRGRHDAIDKILDEEAKKLAKAKERLIKAGFTLGQLDEGVTSDPVALARIARIISTSKSAFWDKGLEWQYAVMLSGPHTHKVNVLGNTGWAAWNQHTQHIAEALVNVVVRDKNSPDFSDLVAFYKGWLASFSDAGANVARAYKTEQSAFEVDLANKGVHIDEFGTKIEFMKHGAAIGGKLGQAIRLPSTTSLLAMDEFFKTLATMGEVHMLSHMAAKADGFTGAELEAEALRRREDYTDPMWEEALYQGKSQVFQEGKGPGEEAVYKVRSWLDNLFGWTPWEITRIPIGTMQFPFVNIPSKIIKVGLRELISPATPFVKGGFSLLSAEGPYRGPKGKAAAVTDTARALKALALIAMVMKLLEPLGDDDEAWPQITGTTPEDAGERGFAYRTAPPYSVYLFGAYRDYRRLDPFATFLAPLVDAGHALKNSRDGVKAERALGALTSGALQAVVEMPFLRGMYELVEGVRSSRESGGKWDKKLVQSWFFTRMVPNLVVQPMRETDPFIRANQLRRHDDESLWTSMLKDSIYRSWPQASKAPPVRYDVWGRPLTRFDPEAPKWRRVVDKFINPMPAQGTQLDDISRLDLLIDRYNHRVESGDLGDVDDRGRPAEKLWPRTPQYWFTYSGKTYYFDEEEYSELQQRAGQMAAEELAEEGLDYANPGFEEKELINKALSRTRRFVRDELIERRVATGRLGQ